MVSKVRVAFVFLVLLVPAAAVIPLLIALDADVLWFKILIPGVFGFGAVVAQSLGWFNKSQD